MDTDKSKITDRATEPEIDPRRRVFIPIEKRQLDGTWRFRTHDKVQYERDECGTIRRVKHATSSNR